MKKVQTLKAYYDNGKVKNRLLISTVNNVDKLFNDVIASATLLASIHKSRITVQRTDTSLYIDYCGISNTNIISKTLLVS
jgi:histone H3/H4